MLLLVNVYCFFRLKAFPPKRALINEYKKMKQHMEDKLPKVFCHNDVHINNIVYDPDNGK